MERYQTSLISIKKTHLKRTHIECQLLHYLHVNNNLPVLCWGDMASDIAPVAV